LRRIGGTVDAEGADMNRWGKNHDNPRTTRCARELGPSCSETRTSRRLKRIQRAVAAFAKALGVTVPDRPLALADEVIE
jgi:hypothetical protein